jgi:hypothetical protein
MPVLILYAKSNRTNKTVRIFFFIKKAFANNMPLLLFNIIIIKGLIKAEQYNYVLLFTIFSFLCSLLVMIIKNNYANKRIRSIKVHKIHTKVSHKSMVYDYITYDFFQSTAIVISLFMIIFMEAIRTKNRSQIQGSQANIFIVLAAVLSLGFSGIIESIPHINWKYYAIVSPQSFLYHFNKTALFLLCGFGVFIAVFIIFGSFIDIWSMFVNLYCMAAVFILSISIAFTFGSMVTKALLLIAAIGFSLWAGFMRSYFMLLLLVPILVSLVKAKSDYREWYVL